MFHEIQEYTQTIAFTVPSYYFDLYNKIKNADVSNGVAINYSNTFI